MTTRWARFARGWLTAAFATITAAVFHVAAGGVAPSGLTVIAVIALSAFPCMLLAGKRLALWRQAASVTLSQGLFHFLFTAGHPALAVSGGSLHGAHQHFAQLASVGTAASALPAVSLGAGALHRHNLTQPSMWIGHAVAALVTILAIRHGESAFWSLTETTRLRVRLLARAGYLLPIRPALPRSTPPLAAAPVLHGQVDVMNRMRRRGPPTAGSVPSMYRSSVAGLLG